jgi:Fe-S-cluster containining protein
MSNDPPSVPAADQRDKLREKILDDCPRLGPGDKFQFACRPGISCYNKCCGDVNIFLSPYDVLRLKKRLGMTSTEFLEAHVLLPVQKDMKTPVVVLKMNADEHSTCPFLTDEGCGVYSDRPWPCRMYPLGLASSKDTPDGWQGERFYFLLQEEVCKGHEETREQTVSQWIDEQGIEEYDRWGEQFKELTLHKFFETGGELSPEKIHMLYTACYDLDKFRAFVFNSTLLERFDLDEDYVEEMRYDDEALLGFAFQWLRYGLFGERTMKARPEAITDVKGRVAKKKRDDPPPKDIEGGPG